MKLKILLVLILTFITLPVHGQDVVSDLLGRMNNLRGSLGIHSYSLNAALSAAARNQASWMAESGQISHVQPDGSTPRIRAQRAGYSSTWVSENIYMGSSATAGSAWNWWLNSPIHYRGITSTNYSEVGIGSASGSNGTAFVLVFGNPGGGSVSLPAAAPAASSASGGGSGANVFVQPIYVVGVDNHGNIMHEIQPGDTLGDIALIYGYTWDDLPEIRSLNGFSETDHYNLVIGSILLVPPYDGTYTPTPGTPDPTATPDYTATPQPTEGPITSGSGMVIRSITRVPTHEPTIEVNPQPIATASSVPDWIAKTAQAELLPSATAPPSPQAVAAVSSGIAHENDAPQTGLIDPVSVEIKDDSGDNTPPLLYIVVVLQLLIVAGAGFEFWRRKR